MLPALAACSSRFRPGPPGQQQQDRVPARGKAPYCEAPGAQGPLQPTAKHQPGLPRCGRRRRGRAGQASWSGPRFFAHGLGAAGLRWVGAHGAAGPGGGGKTV